MTQTAGVYPPYNSIVAYDTAGQRAIINDDKAHGKILGSVGSENYTSSPYFMVPRFHDLKMAGVTNLLSNFNFNNWTNGTSFAGLASAGLYHTSGPDYWSLNFTASGGNTATSSRSTDTPDDDSAYSWSVVTTGGDSNQNINYRLYIPGSAIRNFAGTGYDGLLCYLAVNFWLKLTNTGDFTGLRCTYKVYYYQNAGWSGGVDARTLQSAVPVTANTWTRIGYKNMSGGFPRLSPTQNYDVTNGIMLEITCYVVGGTAGTLTSLLARPVMVAYPNPPASSTAYVPAGMPGAQILRGDYDVVPVPRPGCMVEEQGDILYFDGANWNKLAHGTSGQFLKTQGHGANPIWSAAGGASLTGPVSMSGNTTYTMVVDGGVLFQYNYTYASATNQIKNDGSNPPTTVVLGPWANGGWGNSFYMFCPLKAGYARFELTDARNLTWAKLWGT